MVAGQEDQGAGAAAGVTDWLIKPFSNAYARTKIRAWVLRTACQWMRGSIPADEEQRLASLRAMQHPRHRAGGAVRSHHAPRLRTVRRADRARQPDRRGPSMVQIVLRPDVKETSRDAAFCAHVVYDREPMIVADTFLDARFADNPLVVNEPRIRFYAGYPLILDDGACIGSLCVFDTRPRSPEQPISPACAIWRAWRCRKSGKCRTRLSSRCAAVGKDQEHARHASMASANSSSNGAPERTSHGEIQQRTPRAPVERSWSSSLQAPLLYLDHSPV